MAARQQHYVKLQPELLEKIEAFKQSEFIDNTSEALRRLIVHGLREWQLPEDSDHEE